MKYTVTSHRLAGHDHGDTVTDDDLQGANVPVLIAAGHIAPNEPKPRRKAEPEKDDAS